MEKAKISSIQFFLLLFMFELGTAVVVGHSVVAIKDSWIAILLGMGGGLIVFLIYYALFRYYPSLPLTAYARKIFGPYKNFFTKNIMVGFWITTVQRLTCCLEREHKPYFTIGGVS